MHVFLILAQLILCILAIEHCQQHNFYIIQMSEGKQQVQSNSLCLKQHLEGDVIIWIHVVQMHSTIGAQRLAVSTCFNQSEEKRITSTLVINLTPPYCSARILPGRPWMQQHNPAFRTPPLPTTSIKTMMQLGGGGPISINIDVRTARSCCLMRWFVWFIFCFVFSYSGTRQETYSGTYVPVQLERGASCLL